MSSQVTSLKIIPLHNFSLEATAININEKISIRKLSNTELNKNIENYTFTSDWAEKSFRKKINYGIVIRYTTPLIEDRYRKVCYTENDEIDIIKALHIFKFGHFSLVQPFFFSLSPKSGLNKGLTYSGSENTNNWTPKSDCSHTYYLKKVDHKKLKRFWEVYNKHKKELSLPIALLWQISTCDPFNYKMALINLSTALESLLTKVESELSYKLSVRAACLLAKDKIERQEIRIVANYLYTLRSYYVHGVTDKKRFRKEYEKIWRNLEIIRSTLKKTTDAPIDWEKDILRV